MNALTVSKPCLTPRGPPLLLFHNTHLLILVFFLLSVLTYFLFASVRLAAPAADASPLPPGAKPSPQGPSFSRLWVWLSCVAVAVARNLSSHLPKRAESCNEPCRRKSNSTGFEDGVLAAGACGAERSPRIGLGAR